MKRFTLSVMMTAALGLAAYTFAGAQAPERRGPAGFGGPGGPGGRGGPGAIAMLRGLDLTDQQKADIKAIRDGERDARSGPPADAQLRRQLQAEVFADAPDAQKLASLQQQIVQADAARLAQQIATEQKVAQILTAEQRAKVRDDLAKGPQGRRGDGAGRQKDGRHGRF
jgi:protein CpxP